MPAHARVVSDKKREEMFAVLRDESDTARKLLPNYSILL